jgi:choline-sulfatase
MFNVEWMKRGRHSTFNIQHSTFLVLLILCCHREAPHYNILLITLDTTRADHISDNTPTIQKLARDGWQFTNADSPVPLTLPAHSSILSGVIPPHHGLRNNGAGTFPADRDTLATRLQRAGYRTGAFVSAFVLDHRFGLDRGFDVYDDEIVRDPGDVSRGLEAERRGDVTVDRALAWLKQSDNRPFFAWVHLYDPHAPYAPPAPYPQTYDGELAFTDAQVARLLQVAGENTIIAIVGDHGEGLGEHGELTHGLLLYESTLHVPMIVRVPQSKPRVDDTPVSTVDLAPMLADLVGAPMEHTDRGSHDLYAETQYPAQFGWSDLTAMRRGDVKLIRAPQPEIYDLARDPHENVNRLDEHRREYRDLLARLDGITSIKTVTPPVDEETRAKLASLGYIAPSNAAHAGHANPKDMAPAFRQFEEAHLLIAENKIDAAIRTLEDLVAKDPHNAIFRASLAQAYRQHGNLARAIELYREAAGETPDSAEAWYNLAVALQDAGEQQKAEVAIREALRRDDRRPEGHNVLGIALASAGKLDEAKSELDRALAIDPRNARALNNLGNVLRGMNRIDDAEQAYRRAIAVAPRYADPLNGLGAIEVERNHSAEAIALFDRAIALAPDDYEARLNRAIAIEVGGDRAAAGREYESLLRAIGNRPEYRAQREAAAQLLARLRAHP